MRLLFLTPQLPYPPHQGTTLRNWGLIKGLARRHTVSLLSFVEGPSPEAIPSALREVCERVIGVPVPHRARFDRVRQLASPLPDLAWRLYSPDYLETLGRLIHAESFDAIHVEALEMGRALLHLRGLRSGSKPMLLFDAHNAEQTIQERAYATALRQPARWPAALYSRIQIPRLRRFEGAVARAADRVICVSDEDASTLAALVPGLDPNIAPNGLELSEYESRQWDCPSDLGPFAMVFTGKMDYRPNVDAAEWFATEILPEIQSQCPEAQFLIVGQKPVPRVRALGQRPGVLVTGAVDDVRPYIAHAAVFVAPLRMGGGTRFKLLEAMALGTPIVSTRVGAEGFAVSSGRELLLADTARDFASAVRRLVEEKGLRESLSEVGRSFVRANYDWASIIPKIEAAYA